MPISLKLAGDAKDANQSLSHKEKQPFVPDGGPVSSIAKSPTIGKGRKLLVVDDNAVVLKAFELKLKANGFTVATSSNASQVARTVESTKSELIILDVNFPSSDGLEWNGFTIIQWLRRFPEMVNLPVILISGDGSEKVKQRAMAEGAAAFFQKPVAYEELLATIVSALGIQS